MEIERIIKHRHKGIKNPVVSINLLPLQEGLEEIQRLRGETIEYWTNFLLRGKTVLDYQYHGDGEATFFWTLAHLKNPIHPITKLCFEFQDRYPTIDIGPILRVFLTEEYDRNPKVESRLAQWLKEFE